MKGANQGSGTNSTFHLDFNAVGLSLFVTVDEVDTAHRAVELLDEMKQGERPLDDQPRTGKDLQR